MEHSIRFDPKRQGYYKVVMRRAPLARTDRLQILRANPDSLARGDRILLVEVQVIVRRSAVRYGNAMRGGISTFTGAGMQYVR